MTEERFEEVLADRWIHATEEHVRALCMAILGQWQNVPLRRFWAAQA